MELTTAALRRAPTSCPIDQDLTHRPSGGGKEVRASALGNLCLIDEPEVSLVHEVSGAERLARLLAKKLAVRDALELLIDQGDQTIQALIAAPVLEGAREEWGPGRCRNDAHPGTTKAGVLHIGTHAKPCQGRDGRGVAPRPPPSRRYEVEGNLTLPTWPAAQPPIQEMLMIHRIALGSPAIAALIIIGACDGPASPLSTAPPSSSAMSAAEAPSLSSSSPRTGELHATKACPDYHGNAGDFCSITSSNVAMIEVGSTVFYAKALVDGKMDGDLILVPPGNDNSVAFGHVILDVTTATPGALVTFSGGTGKFRHFSATIIVTPLDRLHPDFVNWNWDGPYSFAEVQHTPGTETLTRDR